MKTIDEVIKEMLITYAVTWEEFDRAYDNGDEVVSEEANNRLSRIENELYELGLKLKEVI